MDSTVPANTRLTNGYLLYDWVMRKSCYPSFWGRPLTGEGAITESEMEFLKGNKGNISLKRQFFIEDGNLEKYTDIDLKTNDELLQVAISEKADDRLKNIVATIKSIFLPLINIIKNSCKFII